MIENKYLEQIEKINNIHIHVFDMGHSKWDKRWRFMHTTSPFHRLYFVLGGDGYVEGPEETTPLPAGHVYLIPAGTTFSYRCTSFIHKLYVHFSAELFPGTDVFENLHRCLRLPYSIAQSRKLSHQMTEGSLFAFKAGLMDVTAQFETLCEQMGIPRCSMMNKKYMPLLSYVKDNLSSRMKIKDIALSLSYCPGTLSKNFRRDTGIGLKPYIEKMLTDKAQQMLLTTNLSIAEIADTLDFCDPYYFSRFFKSQTGTSPRCYRAANATKPGLDFTKNQSR